MKPYDDVIHGWLLRATLYLTLLIGALLMEEFAEILVWIGVAWMVVSIAFLIRDN